VFGALFSSADPMFERLVARPFDLDVDDILGHVTLAGVLSWMTAGYLRGAVSAPRVLVPPPVRPPVGFRSVDVVVALGALDVLFLAFVGVQLRYLFGGEAVVAATTGLTYAEYARQGFFELVTVTALALPVLLAVRWLLVPGDARVERAYRVLAGLLLALLGGIVLSAARRMHLYQEQFGLTESRLYASAFMVWLVQLLALFALTAWRGGRRGFAFGALASGCAMLATLDVMNPDRLIVRANVARIQDGRALDATYFQHLSADAAPAVLAALPSMAPEQRCRAAAVLAGGMGVGHAATRGDWRSWNVARARAWRIAREHGPRLRATACELPGTTAGVSPQRRAR
jgi:hypothetical protein